MKTSRSMPLRSDDFRNEASGVSFAVGHPLLRIKSRKMSTKASTIEYIEDQLADVPEVHTRKMFGEYAVYVGDRVVALVCDDILYVKITGPGKEFVGDRYEEGRAYPGAKPSMVIDDDMIEDREWLCELLRLTEEVLPAPKLKKK